MPGLSLQASAKRPTLPVAADVQTKRPNLHVYITILQGIQDQISFADAKAAFLTSLNIALFGFLALKVDGVFVAYAKHDPVGWAFAVALTTQLLYLSATAGAIAAIVLSVMPRFSDLSPTNKVFFRRIVCEYGKDWSRYVDESNALSDEQWAEQIGATIVELSQVAMAKHQLMRRAAWLTLLAFILWRASLLAIAFLPA